MADCHNLFIDFNGNIWFNREASQPLSASRDALRSKVKKYFKDNQKPYAVSFHEQGSFAMDTIVQQLKGDHDVDDGIYLAASSEPPEARTTIHSWVQKAVEDHTTLSTVDKAACVRVQYKAGHHVDLAIYYQIGNETPILAHKDKWIPSSPKAFIEWFEAKTDGNGQLRRMIRYFKAWLDFKSLDIRGIAMTILVADRYSKCAGDRDDIVFCAIAKSILADLKTNFEGVCLRPTAPKGEDLLKRYSQTSRDKFIAALESLVKSGEQAIEIDVQKEACLKWRKQFGDRFSCDNASDELDEAKSFSNVTFIKHDGRSA